MESAAVEAVDSLAAFGPWYLFAFAVLILVAAVLIKGIPSWEAAKKAHIEIERKESEARIRIEQQREERKAKEEIAREQRDRERSEAEGRWSAQNDRAIKAQEQSNLAMEAVNKQLEIMNIRLDENRASMDKFDDTLTDMSGKVDDLHRHLVSG